MNNQIPVEFIDEMMTNYRLYAEYLRYELLRNFGAGRCSLHMGLCAAVIITYGPYFHRLVHLVKSLERWSIPILSQGLATAAELLAVSDTEIRSQVFMYPVDVKLTERRFMFINFKGHGVKIGGTCSYSAQRRWLTLDTRTERPAMTMAEPTRLTARYVFVVQCTSLEA